MARIGERIEHPLTGERLIFVETAATTGGEYLKISLEMPLGGSRDRDAAVPEQIGHRFDVSTGLQPHHRGAVAQHADADILQPCLLSGYLDGAQHVARIDRAAFGVVSLISQRASSIKSSELIPPKRRLAGARRVAVNHDLSLPTTPHCALRPFCCAKWLPEV